MTAKILYSQKIIISLNSKTRHHTHNQWIPLSVV